MIGYSQKLSGTTGKNAEKRLWKRTNSDSLKGMKTGKKEREKKPKKEGTEAGQKR